MSESELSQCIEREREAVDAFVFSEGPASVDMDSYRAATDEAVRKVEAAFRAMFRLFTGGDRLSHAEWRECTDTVAAYVRGGISTPAPTAQGDDARTGSGSVGAHRHSTATNPENEKSAPEERSTQTIAITEVTNDVQ